MEEPLYVASNLLGVEPYEHRYDVSERLVQVRGMSVEDLVRLSRRFGKELTPEQVESFRQNWLEMLEVKKNRGQ